MGSMFSQVSVNKLTCIKGILFWVIHDSVENTQKLEAKYVYTQTNIKIPKRLLDGIHTKSMR